MKEISLKSLAKRAKAFLLALPFLFMSFYTGAIGGTYIKTGYFIGMPTQEFIAYTQFRHAISDDPDLDWSKIPDFSVYKTDWEKVKAINAWVDQAFPWVDTDEVLFHGMDIWEKPSEMLKNHMGMCREFSVLKYVLLRHYGFKPEDLHLLALYIPEYAGYHAILVVTHNRHLYLLDSAMPNDEILIDGNPLYESLFWMNEYGVHKIRRVEDFFDNSYD